jgi:hypothetical protein
MLRVTNHATSRRALLACLCGAAWAQRPEREGRLRPGDLAPDFRLKKRAAAEFVALSSFRGQKPVALVFGSFT